MQIGHAGRVAFGRFSIFSERPDVPDAVVRLVRLVGEQDALAVAQHQFQYIEGCPGNLSESVSLTEFYEVHDDKGVHVYDVHLFCGDDGQVFVANTKERVASFSQGGATSDDAALERALDDALTRFRT